MVTETYDQVDVTREHSNTKKKKSKLNLRKVCFVSLVVAVLTFIATYFYCIFSELDHLIARSFFGAVIAFPIFFFVILLLDAISTLNIADKKEVIFL